MESPGFLTKSMSTQHHIVGTSGGEIAGEPWWRAGGVLIDRSVRMFDSRVNAGWTVRWVWWRRFRATSRTRPLRSTTAGGRWLCCGYGTWRLRAGFWSRPA